MSDYGEDDYSDYGDDWLYIEDEYMPADDLAEHVVNSPPHTAYADEDELENWDRFDYWNDLEYASDGYDDGKFTTHEPGEAKAGQKRKRGVANTHSKKKQRLVKKDNATQTITPQVNSPVVWRSQRERGSKPKLLDEKTEPYAFLKDWRERLADTPGWASGTPRAKAPKPRELDASAVLESMAPTPENEGEEKGDGEIVAEVVLESIKKHLAAAGGPLSALAPEEILEFAMRMVGDQSAADDVAGKLADDLLGQLNEDDEWEDEDGEAPADLLSWLAQHRDPSQVGPSDPDAAPAMSAPKSPEAKTSGNRPPTPPSSEANRSARVTEDAMDLDPATSKNDAAFKENGTGLDSRHEGFTRKRKAETDEKTGNTSNKRATRSYDTPTAASEAKTVPAKSLRSRRGRRP